MSKYLCLIGLLLLAIPCYGQATTGLQSKPSYRRFYKPPQFAGGRDSLNRYVSRNTHYPVSARENDIEGKVIIRFLVDETGNLSQFRFVRKLGYDECDQEAMRLVKSMPKWQPATYKNKPTRGVTSLPVMFVLQ